MSEEKSDAVECEEFEKFLTELEEDIIKMLHIIQRDSEAVTASTYDSQVCFEEGFRRLRAGLKRRNLTVSRETVDKIYDVFDYGLDYVENHLHI